MDGVAALVELGFTDLEARVYTFLVRENPATGYRIGQAIGKPAANTYKAIESLERKGAIVVESEGSRQCRPLPPEELLARLSREFHGHRESAATALRDLGRPARDERSYPVRTRTQALERVREMLAGAERVALLAAFPSLVAELRSDLESAARRGVDVAIKVYEPVVLDAVEVSLAEEPAHVLARWPGEELEAVVDGKESLVALVARDGSAEGTWSRSAFVGLSVHRGLAAQLCLLNVGNRIHEDASQKRLLKALGSLRHALDTPGADSLVGRSEPRPPVSSESTP